MKRPTISRHRHHRTLEVVALSIAAYAASNVLGCGGPRTTAPQVSDPISQQAQEAEMQGRVMVRTGTDRSVCDASLVFARNRLLGEQTGRQDIARRGRSMSTRLGQTCQSRVLQFWRSYQGCATPIAGRELETSVYWESSRVAAFQQYGLTQVAAIMEQGRERWRASCPTDFAAASAMEPQIRASAPLPVATTQTASQLATPDAAPAVESAPPDTVAQAEVATTTPAAPGDPFAADAQISAGLVAPSSEGYAEALEAATETDAAEGAEAETGEAEGAEAVETEEVAAPAEEALADAAEVAEAAPGEATAAPTQPTSASAEEDGTSDVITLNVSAPPQVFERMRQANALMNAGRYREAYRMLAGAHGGRSIPAVLFNMAICLEHLGEFRRASDLYQRVAGDPVLGPRAQQRISILRFMPPRAAMVPGAM